MNDDLFTFIGSIGFGFSRYGLFILLGANEHSTVIRLHWWVIFGVLSIFLIGRSIYRARRTT